VAANAGAGVKQIVSLDRFRVRIGKNCKRVTGLPAEFAGFFGGVYADRNRANACRVKLVQTPLNAP
jgi:hypothetical protein